MEQQLHSSLGRSDLADLVAGIQAAEKEKLMVCHKCMLCSTAHFMGVQEQSWSLQRLAVPRKQTEHIDWLLRSCPQRYAAQVMAVTWVALQLQTKWPLPQGHLTLADRQQIEPCFAAK